jgi:cell division septation protein DedD
MIVEKPAPKAAETAASTVDRKADKPAVKAADRALPRKAAARAVSEAPPTKASDKSDKVQAGRARTAVSKPVEKAPAQVARADTPAKRRAVVPSRSETSVTAKAQTVSVKADTTAPAKPENVATPRAAAAAPGKPAPSGKYWIQLGAFQDRQNADVLAKAVRDDGFSVHVAPIARGAAETSRTVQQHELFVTDAGVEKVNAALRGRGTAQRAAGGVTVKPAFSLQDAMAVSKRLTDEGLKVVIRPAGGPVSVNASPGTLYAVRAGGYPDRPSAVAARDELAGKGHRGFLAEGPPR